MSDASRGNSILLLYTSLLVLGNIDLAQSDRELHISF